ncbi:hypothetical protein, partial [Microvirga sp. G4-2]|uniref:hypothetical protein n=1 Tax=Microvirga sp. G4-2 TaxID=3434467 RepID=UPI0040441A04
RQDIRGTHRRQVFHRQALPHVLKGSIALLHREYSALTIEPSGKEQMLRDEMLLGTTAGLPPFRGAFS